ncbi:PAS domain S-box protein [Hymenobacter mucosus]|uniref:histidine kinase n=1 Tax=Hymenobacter mucosus TaxID=1411120 RepID=A0A239B394_9BACT|nr:PAS domain S-box protein [Hymenobacter mucosus]SNS01704.1 PAS domain S-box-containing protein [Hymenobacter mucosus]
MSEPENETGRPTPDKRQHALQRLREQAERLQHVTQSLPDGTPASVQRLVQEMQTSQIELEMQYEEVQLAQAEAELLRKQYEDLYEFAPVGYCTLTETGVIEQLNMRACQLLGLVRNNARGRRLALFVAPECREEFSDYLTSLRQTGTRQVCHLHMVNAESVPLYIRVEGQVWDDAATVPTCRLALIDVTAQHQFQQALELSEQHFRILFDQNQDGMLLMRDNRFVDCNQAALRLLGLRSKEELIGRHASVFSPERQANGQFSLLQADVYWEEAIRRGHCRFEWMRLRATGEVFWEDILLTAVPDPENHGRLMVHAIWRDITLEKQASRRVQESEERLQMALAASDTGVWIIDYTTNQVTWDFRSQQIFGRPFSADPAPFQTLQEAIHPHDLAGVAAALERAATDNIPFDLEHRIVWPDGTVRHLAAFGRVLRGDRGQRERFVGLMRDITDRREAEEELGYKNRLLEHILQNMPLALTQLAPTDEYLSATGAGLQRLGITGDDLLGKSSRTLYPQMAPSITELLAGKQVSFLTKIPLAENEEAYYQSYGFFDEHRQEGVCFSIDVTELEQGKERLRNEQEFTKSVLNSTIDIVVALNAKLHVTAWNDKAAALLHRTEAEALGQPLAVALPGIATAPELQPHIERALAGQPSAYANWPGQHQPLIFDLNFVPLEGPDGSSGVLLIACDVTERNALQAETTQLKLRQQKEVLSAILTTQEEERRRIAEGLHNGVGQLLYATRLSLDNMPTSEPVRTSQRLLDEAIRATRSISFELTPGILEDFGLSTALRELVKRVPARHLAVDLNLTHLDEPLPRLLQIAVYRIVQELLSNVMKHAQAQEVFVQVARAEGIVHISVEDDGIGFDPDAERVEQGIGLAGIRTRVELLSGTITIRSLLGRGTTVSLELPLPASEESGSATNSKRKSGKTRS